MTKPNPRIFLTLSFALTFFPIDRASGAPQGTAQPLTLDGTFIGGAAVRNTLSTATSSSKVKEHISFPVPGSVQLNATRYCGDGDVTRYASNHPDVDFATSAQESVSVALGYWFSNAEYSSESVPTSQSWFALGTGTLPIDQQALSNFTPVTAPGTTISGSAAVTSGIQTAINLASTAYEHDTSVSRTVYLHMAAMACNELQSAPAEGAALPPTQQAVLSFFNNAPQKLRQILSNKLSGANTASQLASKTPRLTLSLDGGALKLDAAPSGEVEVDPDFLSLAKKVMDLPSQSSQTCQDIQQKLIQPLADEKASCASMGFAHSELAWWEPFAVNPGCRNLAAHSKLKNEYNQVCGGGSSVQQTDIAALALTLVEIGFYKPIESAMKTRFNDVASALKARCFVEGKPYINKVLASVAFRLSKDNQGKIRLTAPDRMIHPEANFAIGGYQKYNSDLSTILGMTATPARGLPMTLGTPFTWDGADFLKNAMVLKFNVRSYGCFQNYYCQAGSF